MLLLFMLSLIPIIALLGFVVDLGFYYQTKEAATAAAEAGAIAVVRGAMDNVVAGGSYTCGSNGTLCQAATPCAASSSYTNDVQSGCAYVGLNGFSEGGSNGAQSVTIETNTTSPAPSAPGVSVLYWATVRVSQQVPLGFLAVLGSGNLRVAVSSTAAVVDKVASNCIIALDPTASAALSLAGTSSATLTNCAAMVNSSAPDALQVQGGGCLSGNAITVVGGVSGADSCAPTRPTTGATPISDPYASVAPPSFSLSCDHTNFTADPNTPVPPLEGGVYCGGMSISGPANLKPGIYVLQGGGLTCSAQCNMTGTGVTIYNTCSSGYCAGGSTGYGGINISGQATLTLSAPQSGPLAGMLFFQDRSVAAGQSESFAGGSTSTFNGVFYFPKSTATFAGVSAAADGSLIIVADKVSFAGTSTNNVQVSQSGATPAFVPTASLID